MSDTFLYNQSGWFLVRGVGPNGKGMQTGRQFAAKGLVHQPMSLQTVLLSKLIGNDFNPIMRLAAGGGACMPRMQMTLIGNDQLGWLELG